MLTADQKREFAQSGMLLLKGFYNLERDIRPIQLGIHQIIGQVMMRHGVADTRPAFNGATFDSGYLDLIACNRNRGGEIYDAVKQIPAFLRLVSRDRNERVFRDLRSDSIPGIAAGGFGIRIDSPGEERFRAPWHQEYPAQLRSLDGIVFWSPLVEITKDLGPVVICPGSHREGAVPVFTKDPKNPGKSGAYALVLKDERMLVSKYSRVAPCTSPGDLLLLDFLTLHASGRNEAERARWSMQFRYFNFNEPTGRSFGWKGSFAVGGDFRVIHPDLCVE